MVKGTAWEHLLRVLDGEFVMMVTVREEQEYVWVVIIYINY